MTITKERLLKIQHWRETYGPGSNIVLPAEEAEQLARIALASLDAEPVAWTDEQELRDVEKDGCGYLFKANPISPNADPRRVIKLYRHAQPAPVVPDGLRQALSNAGIAAPESDEMLAATCEKYIQMLVTWVKDRKPFQPAPVMPEKMNFSTACNFVQINGMAKEDRATLAMRAWNACPAAMLQGEPQNSQQNIPKNIPAGNSPVIGWLRSDYNSDDKRDPNAPLFMLGNNDPYETWGVKYIPLSGNSPVIPDGYALVPVEPTDEMIVAAMDSDDVTYNESDDTVFYVHHCEIYKAMLAAAPQPETNNK
ncbi:hypothetical protein [Salmonella enterica]|uniref:hypothetical protein n=1 Tax=Salmonella enterica TaxID=28901 RepID=UPI0020CA6458|nr:hypothetical protein [Salmonella enterica]